MSSNILHEIAKRTTLPTPTRRGSSPACGGDDYSYRNGVVYSRGVTAYDPLASSEPQDDASGQNVSTGLEWRDSAAVLTVSGEIDMVTAPRFEEALSSALDKRPEVLVVDLTHVEFFASTGLTALVSAFQQAGEDNTLRVVASGSATVRPLELTGLDQTIPTYRSVELAIAGN